MADEKNWGVVTSVTNLTKNQALAFQIAQVAIKQDICPNGNAVSHVGPTATLPNVTPKKQIESK